MNDYIILVKESIKGGSFIVLIELLGTIAFAISGIRLASAKSFDWFGAIVVGFVTAVGGGTLRDILIDAPVFWLQDSLYLWGTLVAFFVVVVFSKHLVRLNNTIFWFDCLGLALFTIVGFEKTYAMHYSYWVCITMATITGIFGGITRDILINQIPLIFKEELYASACVLGGMLYVVLIYFKMSPWIIELSVFMLVMVVRLVAMRYKIGLPTLKSEDYQKK